MFTMLNVAFETFLLGWCWQGGKYEIYYKDRNSEQMYCESKGGWKSAIKPIYWKYVLLTMTMSFSIWQRIHGSSTPFLLVCNNFHVLSKSALFVSRAPSLLENETTLLRRKYRELLKKPAFDPAGGNMAAGCAEKQKWALMRTTKRNYLPTNIHSSPDTVAIVWPTNCQKFVCSALHAPHASPILNKNCGVLILY